MQVFCSDSFGYNMFYPMMNFNQMPLFWNCPQVAFCGTNSLASHVQTQQAQSKQTNSVIEAGKKEDESNYQYIAVEASTGNYNNINIHKVTPEQIAQFKKEFKSKDNERHIISMALMLGGVALGFLVGPKIFNKLFTDGDPEVLTRLFGAAAGLAVGGLGGEIVNSCYDSSKAKLADKYLGKAINVES